MVTRTMRNYVFRVGRQVSHQDVTNNPARPGGKLTVEGHAKTRARALRIARGQSKPRGYHA